MPINPFTVIPGGDYTAGLQGLGQSIDQFGEQRRAEEEKTRLAQVRQGAIEAFQSGDTDMIAEYSLANPEIAQQLTAAGKFRNQQTKDNYINSIFGLLQDPENAEQIVSARQAFLRSQGVDSEGSIETDGFMEKYAADPEGMRAKLEQEVAWMAPDKYKSYKESTKGPETKTPTTAIAAFLQKNPNATIDEIADYTKKLKEQPEGQGATVGAQEILEDGTIIQSTQKGPVVWSADGTKLKGKEAKDAITQARDIKVSNLRKAAGEKRTAALEAEQNLKGLVEAGVISQTSAAKISVDAFDKLEKINTNIANMDEAIQLIDEGAETGFIMSKLPSVRAASVKLDNLQGRLGLDIIGATTFGALSENELKFALATALPQKLKGPELKQWLIEKKAAQSKLSDYLESTAIYLGIPGNTVRGLYEKKRNEQGKNMTINWRDKPAEELTTEQLKEIVRGGK